MMMKCLKIKDMQDIYREKKITWTGSSVCVRKGCPEENLGGSCSNTGLGKGFLSGRNMGSKIIYKFKFYSESHYLLPGLWK